MFLLLFLTSFKSTTSNCSHYTPDSSPNMFATPKYFTFEYCSAIYFSTAFKPFNRKFSIQYPIIHTSY